MTEPVIGGPFSSGAEMTAVSRTSSPTSLSVAATVDSVTFSFSVDSGSWTVKFSFGSLQAAAIGSYSSSPE